MYYIKEGKILDKETKPPTRFTPSSLLAAMKNVYKYLKDKNLQPILKECHGIGTEATRASIIETLQTRGYLVLEKKHLVPTDKAYQLCEVLFDDILYPDTTAMWEKDLDAIRDGESMDGFFKKQKEYLISFLGQAKNAAIAESKDIVKCPKCGKPLRLRKGKNGSFWGCSGYPECNITFPNKKGKPDFDAKKSGGTGVTTEAKCPICGSDKLKQVKTKKGTTAWICEGCNTWFNDKKNAPDFGVGKCPTCGKGIIRKIKGKKGNFWGCSNRDCNQTYPDKNGKPDMS